MPPSLPPGQWIGGLRELGADWACPCIGMHLRGSPRLAASNASQSGAAMHHLEVQTA